MDGSTGIILILSISKIIRECDLIDHRTRYFVLPLTGMEMPRLVILVHNGQATASNTLSTRESFGRTKLAVYFFGICLESLVLLDTLFRIAIIQQNDPSRNRITQRTVMNLMVKNCCRQPNFQSRLLLQSHKRMRLITPHPTIEWKHRSDGLIQSLTQQRLSSVKEESNRDARCVIEASCQIYLLYLLDLLADKNPKAFVKRLRRLGKVIARKSPGASGEKALVRSQQLKLLDRVEELSVC